MWRCLRRACTGRYFLRDWLPVKAEQWFSLKTFRLFWSGSRLRFVSIGWIHLAELQPSQSLFLVAQSVFYQPSAPVSFSSCVESMGSPRRLLRSTALPSVGGDLALPPIYFHLIHHSSSLQLKVWIACVASLFRKSFFAHCRCTLLSRNTCEKLCFSFGSSDRACMYVFHCGMRFMEAEIDSGNKKICFTNT